MEAQKVTGVLSLAGAAPTRWGTIQAMCQTILDSERLLYTIVTARDFVVGNWTQKAEREKVKALIINEHFVTSLEKALAILAPIDKLIVKYQSENVPVSEVLPDFHDLPDQFKFLREKCLLTQDEFTYLCQLSKHRFQFMYGAAHGLAYILDPRYLGVGLPSENRRSIEEILIRTSGGDGISNAATKEAIYMQFTDFFISASQERSENSFRFQMLDKKRKTPLQYWLSDGVEWPAVQEIAVKIFSLATSSPASERNFSTFGFIHSKLRNSLSSQSVEKLVFIKTNLNTFYEDPVGLEMDADNSDDTDE
jgi:hypothetical protein